MHVTVTEIIQLVRRIARHPAMFSIGPEEANGIVQVLAVIAVAEATGLYNAYGEVGDVLLPLALSDVKRESNVGVRLCDESVEMSPDLTSVIRRTSYDAFTRHTMALLDILASRGISAPDDGL